MKAEERAARLLEIADALSAARTDMTALEVDCEGLDLEAAWMHIADAIAEIKAVAEPKKPAKVELIDCTNYFNDVGCKRLQDALEAGKTVRIYIDCIGHTRNMIETAAYDEYLRDTYGDRLQVISGNIDNHYRLAY